MNWIEFSYHPNKSKVDGFFDEEDGQIYIRKNQGRITKEIIFAHESQHKDCCENSCFCWVMVNLFWCEYHAFRAELYYVLDQNKSRIWNLYFQGVIKDLTKYYSLIDAVEGQIQHFKALRKVCKMKLFREFAKQYGYYTKIYKLCGRVR